MFNCKRIITYKGEKITLEMQPDATFTVSHPSKKFEGIKEIDMLLGDLERMKEHIDALVERYKELTEYIDVDLDDMFPGCEIEIKD